jgi:hypothetical protein
MATVSGVVYTERTAPVPGTTSTTTYNWMTAGYVDGRKKIMMDYYVGLGTEASGTLINMCAPLPQGAMVLSVSVISSANTSSLTFSVGDLSSATRYASAASGIATAGITIYTGMISSTTGWYIVGTNPGTGANALTQGDAQILITTGGATLGTGTIYGVIVEYTTD